MLCEAGYAVRVITRQAAAHPWLQALPVEIIETDIAEREGVLKAAEGVRYIIHAAGLFRFFGKASDFENTNRIGTQNILEAGRLAGVEKIVHMSTIAVAGFPRNPHTIIDENYPPAPIDDYQRTKLAGEKLALEHVQAHQLPVVIVRGGAFYGPYGRYAFNKLFIEDPIINRLPLGVDGGRHIMFPAYIKDVVRGMLLALEKGRVGEIYNIASQSLSHRTIDRTISQIAGVSPLRLYAPGFLMLDVARILTLFSRLFERELRYVVNMKAYTFGEWNVSIEKARRELGYEPTPFEEGIRETLRWYLDSGLWKPRRRPALS
jgi:dihydroflavonol-4-reductase